MPESLSFGVAPVDKLLPAAPSGSSILLVNDPGVESEAFLYQVAHHHFTMGHPVVYACTTRPPSSVKSAMLEHGFDPDPDKHELVFVDLFSALLGGGEEAAYTVDDPSDIQQIAQVLKQAADEHPGAVLCIDSLSGLADQATPEQLVEQAPALTDALSAYAYSVSLFTDWPYGFDKRELTDRFDAVIRVGGLEERVVFGQYFQVQRAAWAQEISPQR
ncbi:MAG: RAD55 family ATPase, partial [Candidatus Thermoplasmatota archaeon]|nr:RAD55 family ATPase [Candidatus Thermoplasmatota archaeon]